MKKIKKMAQKLNPKCVLCESTDSLMWRTSENEMTGHICQNCYEKMIKPAGEQQKNMKIFEEKKLRKSTRILKKSKYTSCTTANGVGGNDGIVGRVSTKGGKIKRIAQKKFKSPTIPLTMKSVESVYHNGTKIQIGDIVSLMDIDGNLFYAQIRGFTVDIYCEKYAYITWLLPTQVSPPPNEGFDASSYLIGHDEDTPRSVNLLEFVMHAPSNYYYDKTQPIPIEERPAGYTWSRLKRPQLGPATKEFNSILTSPENSNEGGKISLIDNSKIPTVISSTTASEQ